MCVTLFGWLALQDRPAPPTDASGMAWIEGDTFLVVHDAKRPGELARPRVSRVQLPSSAEGVVWTPLEISWPEPEGPSHDLESMARVSGTNTYLLAESGDDGVEYRRIYAAEYEGGTLRIESVIPWPIAIKNVEGMAVGRVGKQFVFVCAERAHGRSHTELAWASFTLHPPAFGNFQKTYLPNPGPDGPDARPVSALEFDAKGRLYAASTRDPETEEGPFHSAVWDIGFLQADVAGRPRLVLRKKPVTVATLDGLKVESLAVREGPHGSELFVGTDDEHYGAIIRPLLARQ
ncbi:MAG: hypothetical protein H6Q07_3413 [Acidobacteria bacterium]|nr:hypothetical protein [Acidobacteriota bacterium]